MKLIHVNAFLFKQLLKQVFNICNDGIYESMIFFD